MNNDPKHSQETLDIFWHSFIAIMVALTVMYLPLDAMAQLSGGAALSGEGTSVSGALCNVIAWFNGPIGKGIATLALVIVGIGALMGKVSWGMAIIVGMGVALVFGATTIVDAIGGQGSQSCSGGNYKNQGTTG